MSKFLTPLRSVLTPLARPLLAARGSWHARNWADYSRLFLISDSDFWVISWELRELGALARSMGVETPEPYWFKHTRRQAVFLGDHFMLADPHYLQRAIEQQHHIGTAFFHGRPSSSDPHFDQAYLALCKHHTQLTRIQVSHSEMENVVLESGISPEKVFRIPIGVNLDYFPSRTPVDRLAARAALGIPETAVVIGSFQKDGVGWGDGMEPKLIKGPDVFVETLARLKHEIPEVYVLLTGPARGYVKAGLEKHAIPYKHLFLQNYPDILQAYQALDLYLVASRQEGGPKAVLESMAVGVPLVTTRVGQAMDLVQHEKNGWMVEVEDVDGLVYWAAQVLGQNQDVAPVLRAGRQTAEQNSYPAQQPLWSKFMQGFAGPAA